ncbi:PD-(D/E)XK nuclease family protein [Peptoniphilus sp. KCTC 25270]|uniref:PD-(D/E)XK nuclease family protein n=1 Tax=Peptoniphilus sp. KCTC 25270 TaxID=2897414 RepID=UPI001E317DBD|nr:PD-(D/E)XK nuclease family protein [Peptoniphilus sp. KCTC 25270]MCD1146514.1 PD-(D/E)XK nuclease family protein [Peptoniphilus sp. KCTC 25270]
MNRGMVYPIGQGRRDFIEELGRKNRENPYEKRMILLPNRSSMESLKREIAERFHGYIGLEFFTFDDLARYFSFGKEEEKMPFFPYMFQEKLKERKEEFPYFGESFAFLSSIESFLSLFEKMEEGEKQGEEFFQKIPVTGREEMEKIYLLYKEYGEKWGITSIREIYKEAIENIQEGIFEKEELYFYGFSRFRPMEGRLLKALVKGNFSITGYLSFEMEQGHEFFEETLEKLEKIGFLLERREEENPAPFQEIAWGKHPIKKEWGENLFFLQSHRKQYLHEEILDRALLDNEKFHWNQMGILVTSEGEKEEYRRLAKAKGIPLEEKRGELNEEKRSIFATFLQQGEYSQKGMEGLIYRLESSWHPIVEEPEKILEIFYRTNGNSYEELIHDFQNHTLLDLREEDIEILQGTYEKIQEDMSHCPKGKFSEILDYLSWKIENMKAQVEEELKIWMDEILEILSSWEAYRSHLEEMELSQFLSILKEEMERKEEIPTYEEEGLRILTLQESMGTYFPWLGISNLEGKFPQSEPMNFFYHLGNREEWIPFGPIFEGETRKEEMEYVFFHALSQGDVCYLGQGGEEEDVSPIWIQLEERLEEINKKSIHHGKKKYRMHHGEEEKYKYSSERNPMKLEERIREDVLSSMKNRKLSATFLDQFIKCPYAFYMDQFLMKDSLPKSVAMEQALSIGKFYHFVLEGFFKQGKNIQELPQLMDQYLYRVDFMERFEPLEFEVMVPLWKKSISAFIAIDEERRNNEKKDGGFYPKAFEERFEMEVSGYKWVGVIDRIDENALGQEIVVDFKKKSGVSPSVFAQGKSFQLPLYAYSRYLQGKEVVSLGYGEIEKGKFSTVLRNEEAAGKYFRASSSIYKNQEEMEAFYREFPEKLTLLLKEIEKGEYPPIPEKPENCNYCQYKEICRKEQYYVGTME